MKSPGTIAPPAWVADGLLLGPLSSRFWYALLYAILLLGPYLLAIFLAVREYAQR
ncbi:hypothetical protein ABZV14_14985 [Streptosporangium canum]|uniref:hypothetical protein n=1 Tax=Streptosporangium canum TaxID=324952 RepID=UPI0033A07703